MQKLQIREMGPIYKAEVELKPLTVFAGASNTGKSYLATMIYAIHTMGGEFSRLIAGNFMSGANKEDPHKSKLRELKEFTRWMKEAVAPSNAGNKTRSIDIPKKISDIFDGQVSQIPTFSSFLNSEMPNFIDPSNEHPNGEKKTGGFAVGSLDDPGKNLLEVKYSDQERKYEPRLSIDSLYLKEDVCKLAARIAEELEERLDALDVRIPEGVRNSGNKVLSELRFFSQILLEVYYSNVFKNTSTRTEFLPASRSALMIHKHVFSSAALHDSIRSEKNHNSTLDPVLASFLANINDPNRGWEGSSGMKKLGEEIEREILGGDILIAKDKVGSLSYLFNQSGTAKTLPLSKVSSMISALAPLVVYIKDILSSGDTLIIEEPESHLHPRMQEKITDCIILLVKSGVNVIITTHSEWITDRLSYLIQLSKLGEGGKSFDGYRCAISEENVGVWEFRRSSESVGSTVTKVEFENETYDLDYSNFGIETFNQHDLLDTRLEEIENGQQLKYN